MELPTTFVGLAELNRGVRGHLANYLYRIRYYAAEQLNVASEQITVELTTKGVTCRFDDHDSVPTVLRGVTLDVPPDVVESGVVTAWLESSLAAVVEERATVLREHNEFQLHLIRGQLAVNRRAVEKSESMLEEMEAKYLKDWGVAPP